MGVEFFEDNNAQFRQQVLRTEKVTGLTGLTGLVVKAGIASGRAGAEKALIVVMLISFGLTAFLWYRNSQPNVDIDPRVESEIEKLQSEGYEGGELLIELGNRLGN
jgi:hypothetical protein